jgi:hypothetical protein
MGVMDFIINVPTTSAQVGKCKARGIQHAKVSHSQRSSGLPAHSQADWLNGAAGMLGSPAIIQLGRASAAALVRFTLRHLAQVGAHVCPRRTPEPRGRSDFGVYVLYEVSKTIRAAWNSCLTHPFSAACADVG